MGIEPSTPGQTIDVARTEDFDTPQNDPNDLRKRKPQKTDLRYQMMNESEILR